MPLSLHICAARDGGFVIDDAASGRIPGHLPEVLFAGSAEDCLEYLRGQLLAEAPASPPSELTEDPPRRGRPRKDAMQ